MVAGVTPGRGGETHLGAPVFDSTHDAVREEGADVKRRDFVGLDFTAWVYDLFRPDEPYKTHNESLHTYV